MNFNFSFSSSYDNRKKSKKGLTPQEEYWLDRILRNHSTQIFIVIVLFSLLIITTVLFSIFYPDHSAMIKLITSTEMIV